MWFERHSNRFAADRSRHEHRHSRIRGLARFPRVGRTAFRKPAATRKSQCIGNIFSADSPAAPLPCSASRCRSIPRGILSRRSADPACGSGATISIHIQGTRYKRRLRLRRLGSSYRCRKWSRITELGPQSRRNLPPLRSQLPAARVTPRACAFASSHSSSIVWMDIPFIVSCRSRRRRSRIW